MIRLSGRTLAQETEQAQAGGDRSRLGTKLPVRERLALLLDPGSFVEDGLLAGALEGARIGAMAGAAAVNAVWAKRIEAIEDDEERREFVAERVAEYEPELDAIRLASELLIEPVIEPAQLRGELVRRLAGAAEWQRDAPGLHHGSCSV